MTQEAAEANFSKGMNDLISQFEGRGFTFVPHNGRVRILHVASGSVIMARPRSAERDLKGVRSRMNGIIDRHEARTERRDQAPHAANKAPDDEPLGTLEKLSLIGEDEVDFIERAVRGDALSGAVRVTADMVGQTLIIHEGRIVAAPEVLMRVLRLISSGPTVSFPAEAPAPQRRAVPPGRAPGRAAEQMEELLREIFSRHPGKALRTEDLYAAIPDHLRARYNGMESCRSTFSRPLQSLVKKGVIRIGRKVGRKKTWVTV